ncbi:MAG: S24 family peptidase [Planctomycetota bacterium]
MSYNLKKVFGQRFRAAREAKKLSRAALSLRLSISPKTIQSWEMGRTFIENLSLLPAIESELQINVIQLLAAPPAEEENLAAESPAGYGAKHIVRATERVPAGPQFPIVLFPHTDETTIPDLQNAYVAVPLLKPASAAKPIDEIQKKDIVRQCLFPASWFVRGHTVVAYRMADSSMAPSIRLGAVVLVNRRQTSPNRLNGRMAAIWLADRGLRIRRILVDPEDGSVEGVPDLDRTRGRIRVDLEGKDRLLGSVLGLYEPLDE